jgi:hypothetical protein
MRVETCRLCSVQILKVRHYKTDKWAPIEIQPSADGNVLVTGDLYEIVPKAEREGLIRRGVILRKNHFATCPYARTFSDRKRARAIRNRAEVDQEKTAA